MIAIFGVILTVFIFLSLCGMLVGGIFPAAVPFGKTKEGLVKKRGAVLKLYGSVFIVLFIIIAITAEYDSGNEGFEKFSSSSKYTLSATEALIIDLMIKEDIEYFIKGEPSLIFEKFPSVSAVIVAKSYEQNQVAADQKYYNKEFLLTGIIEGIHSGLGNEPYITLKGVNMFSLPQAKFKNENLNRISGLTKGKKISLHCTGAGAIIGTAMFKDCEFSDEYAKQIVSKIPQDINRFLNGKEPNFSFTSSLVTLSISAAKLLPQDSVCITRNENCMNEIKGLNEGILKNEIESTAIKLTSLGLMVPEIQSKN